MRSPCAAHHPTWHRLVAAAPWIASCAWLTHPAPAPAPMGHVVEFTLAR